MITDYTGKIPKGWKAIALGDEEYLKVVSGGTPETKKLEYWDGDILWATPTDITNLNGNHVIKDTERKITQAGVDGSSAKHIPAGSVLMTSRATIGEAAINEVPITTNQGFQSFICSDKLYNYYLLYSIQLWKNKIAHLGGQSTFKEVNKTLLKKFQIPIPKDVDEQTAIADLIRSVDDAILSVDRAIDVAERVKRGLMQDLLTRGIGHTEFRFSKELQCDKPREWNIEKLGKVCDRRIESIQPSGTGKNIYVGLDHIEPGQINLKQFSFDTDIRSLKNKFYKNDILYGKLRPYLDKAVLSHVEGLCSTDILVLKCNKTKAISRFIVYILHTNRFLNLANATTSGTNHPRTSWKWISRFLVGLPDLPEQKKISDYLFLIDNKIDLEYRRKEKLLRIKKGLMQDLLTGRKRFSGFGGDS